MKRTNLFRTKIGIRLLFLSLSFFLFTMKVSAQRHGGHLPFDSTSVGGDTAHFPPPPPGDTAHAPHWPIDTIGGWTGDTIHRHPHWPIDSTGWAPDTNWHFPPHPIDTGWVWGDSTGHNPPPPGDSTGWSGGDTTGHNPPPPGDSTGWSGGDTTGHNPPPPGDLTGWSGGDTTGHTPPPPGDSTGWSGGDTTGHTPAPPGDSTGWSGGDTTGHNPPPPGDLTWVGDTTGTGGGDSTGTCGGDSSGHGKPGIDIGGGLNGITAAVEAAVYPNPISSTAVLNIKNSSGNVTFRMLDGAGRTVMVKTNLTNGNVQLNKETLAPGLYFYEVDDNGTKTSGQIVIQ